MTLLFGQSEGVQAVTVVSVGVVPPVGLPGVALGPTLTALSVPVRPGD